MDLRERLIEKGGQPRRVEKHDIPEWEETIWIRALKSRELDAFEAARLKAKEEAKGEDDLDNFRAKFCVLVICDEQGNRTMCDDDVAIIGEWPASVTDKIFDKGQRLSGRRKEDADFFTKSSANGTHRSESNTKSPAVTDGSPAN